MVFPWQLQQWQQLWQAKRNERLPHALLLSGMAGIGKKRFAESFIRAQACQHVADAISSHESISQQCRCHHCCLITGRVHPNVLWVTPDKPGGVIKVDQIREVNTFVNQSSLQGEWRFVLIYPADHMNINAANALLKTLEEPAAGAILMLVSDQAARLPATILSRCQRMHFPKPPTDLALSWLSKQLPAGDWDANLLLNLANGAPIAALQLTASEGLAERKNVLQALQGLIETRANPLAAAASLQAIDLLYVLDLTLTWVMDLLRLKLQGDEQVVNVDIVAQLKQLQAQLTISPLIKFMDYLQRLRGHISSGINLNKQLAIEDMMIHCHGMR